jgi:hypothetical protein
MRRLSLPLVALTLGGLGLAHIQLVYQQNGSPLSWSNPSAVSIVIHEGGSADIAGASDELAIRNGIDAWNEVDGTTAHLVEVTSPSQRARTDHAAQDLHLVMFDETNASGYFPAGTGTVALTPLLFYTSGQILDADILFNGSSYAFTTRGQAGRFDVQDVVTHELGHFLGLDHSGVAGSTMFPYVDTAVILHRSLSTDDVAGIRSIYPDQSFGRITGTVQRADGSPVAGAHVTARDSSGRTAAAALGRAGGSFTIEGLEPGTYEVLAHPFDQPVGAQNVSAWHTIETDFSATSFGSVTVFAGEVASLGAQTVAADSALIFGRSYDDYPQRVIQGQTTVHVVRGAGLVAGSTLTASDTGITVTPTVWSGSQVQFQVTCPAGAAPGHFDLEVVDPSGARALLAGGLEVTPPNPVVSSVSPNAAVATGGALLNILGSGFRPGCRVILGDRVYVEGQAGGPVLVDSSRLRLALASTVAGVHDVVVLDPTGVEGRLSNGFHAQANPTIAVVFPAAGQASGGTRVRVSGTNFQPGSTVSIDGVPQGQVSFLGDDLLEVITAGGIPGGPYVLTVTTPTGEQASSAFVYQAKNDPSLVSVSPAQGPSGGGNEVTLSVEGLPASFEVLFGAHPDTGAGGAAASLVSDPSGLTSGPLTVVAPAGSPGTVSVVIRDTETGQASVLEGGYSYSAPPPSPTGGGCGSVVPMGPGSWRDLAGHGGWLAVLWLVLTLRARRPLVPARA